MILLLIVCVLAIYSRSIRGDFLFDDHAITDMDFDRWRLAWQGKDVECDPPSFKKAFCYSFMEPRSLTHMGYQWTWQLAGFRPIVWHSINVVFHLANTFLVFSLAYLVRPEVATPAAFLFAVHPHQVAAVSYVSGRSSLQTAFFALSSLYIAFTIPLVFAVVPLCLSLLFATRSKEDGYAWILLIALSFAVLYVLFH